MQTAKVRPGPSNLPKLKIAYYLNTKYTIRNWYYWVARNQIGAVVSLTVVGFRRPCGLLFICPSLFGVVGSLDETAKETKKKRIYYHLLSFQFNYLVATNTSRFQTAESHKKSSSA